MGQDSGSGECLIEMECSPILEDAAISCVIAGSLHNNHQLDVFESGETTVGVVAAAVGENHLRMCLSGDFPMAEAKASRLSHALSQA